MTKAESGGAKFKAQVEIWLPSEESSWQRFPASVCAPRVLAFPERAPLTEGVKPDTLNLSRIPLSCLGGVGEGERGRSGVRRRGEEKGAACLPVMRPTCVSQSHLEPLGQSGFVLSRSILSRRPDGTALRTFGTSLGREVPAQVLN